MELAEHLAKLYQALANACRDRVERVPAAEDRAEELLVEAEERARNAPAPGEREAYETFLLAAGLALQKPERAIPILEQSETDRPGDERLPLQLARAYAAAGRFADAMAACDRAMGKSQGVAQLAVYTAREQIERRMGDEAGARQTLQASRIFACALRDAARAAAGKTG
jgi:tetratricopeptide (TPR) repeat protein